MIFRPGQRVKRIPNSFAAAYEVIPAGSEGTVASGVSGATPGYLVNWDGQYPWWSVAESLVPLTDPKADAFIESVKKWKPEPVVPLPAKVTNFNNIRENAK